MAKKGKKKHLKRLNAPKVRKVPRKENKWTITTSSGPHPAKDSLPLLIALRDHLGLVRNKKEAQRILGSGEVEIDGKVRKDLKYPVGLMDIVKVPKTGDAWRVLHDRKGYLVFHPVKDKESELKLVKVVEKSPFKGGGFQLTFHDGKNMVGDFGDVAVGDTLKIKIPELDVLGRISYEEGKIALITGGSNVGRVGEIKDIIDTEGPTSSRFLVDTGEDEFQTSEEFIFLIGDEEPQISLLEVSE